MVNADLGTLPPGELRQVINSWPTFTAQKIQVTDLADDWTSVTVRLDLTPRTPTTSAPRSAAPCSR